MLAEDRALIAARRRVCDALHAMHRDQNIRIDEGLALELDAAWDAYDTALLASAHATIAEDDD